MKRARVTETDACAVQKTRDVEHIVHAPSLCWMVQPYKVRWAVAPAGPTMVVSIVSALPHVYTQAGSRARQPFLLIAGNQSHIVHVLVLMLAQK